MAKPYPPEVQAAVLALLATGDNIGHVAKRHGIARATVQNWVRAAHLPKPSPRLAEKKLDIGAELFDYLGAAVRTLRLQLDTFGDTAWLKTQPAGELAILHGVIADKATRLLAAIQRADESTQALVEAEAEPDATEG